MVSQTAKVCGCVRASALSPPRSVLRPPTLLEHWLLSGKERDLHWVGCCLNVPTKVELDLQFFSGACSNSPASDNKCFVLRAHSVERTIRPAQRHSIYTPDPLYPSATQPTLSPPVLAPRGAPLQLLVVTLYVIRLLHVLLESTSLVGYSPREDCNKLIISMYHGCLV